MEESVSLLKKLKTEFACEDVDIRTYSPLTLAYMGDVVYEIMIRTVVVERGNRAAERLHKTTVKYVNAATQAAMIEVLKEELSDEEMAVYRRGRNAKSYTAAKNASIGDYRRATGFEALLGYLYLQNNMERAIELVKRALEKLNLEI